MKMLETPCVEWTRSRGKQRYGIVHSPGRKKHGAHRVAWISKHGPIPKGMCVLHRCDNPPCVNVGHLYLGTVQDNNRDRKASGHYLGEWNGRAKLTADNVTTIRGTDGSIGNEILAKRFNVSIDAVWRARTGRTWKSVAVKVRP